MPKKKIDTSVFKLNDDVKEAIAGHFGEMVPLSEILDELLKAVKQLNNYPDITDEDAKGYLRESIRTCNRPAYQKSQFRIGEDDIQFPRGTKHQRLCVHHQRPRASRNPISSDR